MRGGRILWGQIAVVFAIVLVMVWAATQWTAFRLGFQPQLGAPWFELAGLPIYYPPAFFWWWFSFDAYAPAIFGEGGIIAVSGGFLAIAAAIFMSTPPLRACTMTPDTLAPVICVVADATATVGGMP